MLQMTKLCLAVYGSFERGKTFLLIIVPFTGLTKIGVSIKSKFFSGFLIFQTSREIITF